MLLKKDANMRLFLRPEIGPYAVRSQGWRYGECPWMGGIPQRARMAVRQRLCIFALGMLSSFAASGFSSPDISEPGLVSTDYAASDGNCSVKSFDDTAYIKYIHDGDTLHLKDGRKIRLIGINTPELARNNSPAEPYAFAAKDTLTKLFKQNKSIGLVFGKNKKDHYGRVLAHVFLGDGDNTQEILLKQGYASAIIIPPNTQFSDCYLEAEKIARCDNRGIWKNNSSRGNSILEAEDLTYKHKGFHLINGRVKSIDINKKGIWLNIDDKLTVGIRPENLTLFDLDTIKSWKNQPITVRGWLNSSNKSNPFYIRVRHPSSIQLTSVFSCN
jgi:endonuclease YncB( thermonuclease family)